MPLPSTRAVMSAAEPGREADHQPHDLVREIALGARRADLPAATAPRRRDPTASICCMISTCLFSYRALTPNSSTTGPIFSIRRRCSAQTPQACRRADRRPVSQQRQHLLRFQRLIGRRESLSTMSGGVPAGARNPIQMPAE